MIKDRLFKIPIEGSRMVKLTSSKPKTRRVRATRIWTSFRRKPRLKRKKRTA